MMQALSFTAPYQVAVRAAPLPRPGEGELLVQSCVSAISAGTEMLLYRGQMPADMALDETLDALQGPVQYPLQYGYATVGKVIAVGKNVDNLWINRLVFAFYPHVSHFTVAADAVQPVPAGVSAEAAVFLPNVETAVSFLMDSRPVIGERAAVFGQGVVGLLTTALLARLPLAEIVAVDGYAHRREQALAWGAMRALDPAAAETLSYLQRHEVDVSYELSGNPAALDLAIAATGFSGRILVGSWYGLKRAPIDLGGKFHRSHLTLVSSQVSHLHPRWRGRWTKARRLQTAWRMLKAVRPDQLITHRFPLARAAEAYALLDQNPGEAIQVVFEYDV